MFIGPNLRVRPSKIVVENSGCTYISFKCDALDTLSDALDTLSDALDTLSDALDTK